MDRGFSFSIFTIEINGRPTLALQARRHRDVERLCEDGRLRTRLSTITSHGTPLCDASATMKVRLAYRRRSSPDGSARRRGAGCGNCCLAVSDARDQAATIRAMVTETKANEKLLLRYLGARKN
jgi:hypothetical protein